MASLPLALRAARHGSTVLVQGDLLGGTCLNPGCIRAGAVAASRGGRSFSMCNCASVGSADCPLTPRLWSDRRSDSRLVP